MRQFKNITFSEGISCTLAEFKKDFAPHLKKLSADEVKQAHKVATEGNSKPKKGKESDKNELSNSNSKSEEANTSEDKQ